jgi:Cu/Ag efflux protein CusF
MSKPTTKNTSTKTDPTTKPLTRDQINHAKRRVEALAEKHIAKIRAENNVNWNRAQTMLTQEIAAGRFTVKPKSEIAKFKSGDDLHNILNFKNFPKGLEDVQELIQSQQINWQTRVDTVKAARDKIIDNLILGDARGALKTIAEFEMATF